MKVKFNHNERALYKSLCISEARFKELDEELDHLLYDMINPLYGYEQGQSNCASEFLERAAEIANTPEELIFLSYMFGGAYENFALTMKDSDKMMEHLSKMLGIPYQKQAPLTDDGKFFKVSMS